MIFVSFLFFFLDSRHFVGIIDTWIYIKRFLEHFFFVITINFARLHVLNRN